MYATTSTLQTILVSVDFDTATTSLVSWCIGRAENEVNKYLSKRYDLASSPFNTTASIPPIVRSLTEDLSAGYYYIHSSRSGKESISLGKELIKSALDNLKNISEYKLDVLDTAGSAVTESEDSNFKVESSTMNYQDTFDLDTSTSWAIDGDRLDDIATNRG